MTNAPTEIYQNPAILTIICLALSGLFDAALNNSADGDRWDNLFAMVMDIQEGSAD